MCSKIEIDVLSVNLERLPPTQLNFLVEESSYDSSNENNIERDNKEAEEHTDNNWGFNDVRLLCAK